MLKYDVCDAGASHKCVQQLGKVWWGLGTETIGGVMGALEILFVPRVSADRIARRRAL